MTYILRAAVVSLAALMLSCATQQPNAISMSDDEKVLETAMLSFYAKSDWNTPDWTRGDFVVVRPGPLTKKRPDFDATLKECVSLYESEIEQSGARDPAGSKSARAKTRELRDIEQESHSPERSYHADAIARIDAQHLDPRIVIADPKTPWIEAWPQPIENRLGRSGRIRAIVSTPPPGYSRDGQFAVLKGDAPWSIHDAGLTFILRRSSTGWRVVYADALYYV